jgi:two-component system cell cycle sensor histidine kinase/response regulator CckA
VALPTMAAAASMSVERSVPHTLDDQQPTPGPISGSAAKDTDDDRAPQLERANRELAAREARWRAIFEAEPECVKLVSEEGALLEMNPAGLRMIEADSLDQVRNHLVDALVVPEQRDTFRALTRRVFSGESATLEFEIIGLKGGRRCLATHATPLRDDAGRVTAMLGITHDVTDRKMREAELRESSERLRLAVQASNVGIWDWDLRAGSIVFSREWKLQLGFEEHEIGNDIAEWRDRLHPDDLPPTLARLEWYLAHPVGIHEVEFRMRHKDGSWRWMYSRGELYRDATGKPARMIGCHVDVTERTQSEHHIRQLNRTYAVLSDINQLIVRERDAAALFEGACRIAVDEGGFLLAWIGLREDVSRRLVLVAHAGAGPETLDIVRMFLEAQGSPNGCAHTFEAFTTGQPSICNDIGSDPRASHWAQHAVARGYRAMASLPLSRGSETIGTFNLYAPDPDFFDESEVGLLSQLAADISFGLEAQRQDERRGAAERALRASEERFRELAETIQEVFWITDARKAQLLYVSPAYETVWGRTRASVYAAPSSWADAIHPDDRERVVGSALTDQLRGEYDEEYRILRPDGAVRWIRERAFPVRHSEGHVERIVGVARDVTDRKAAEEQAREAQKMESVGRLAAGLAHDFNNVLTVINGLAELARGELPQGSPLREHLDGIQAAGGRAAQLTRQLLAFSRKQVLHPTIVSLNALAREAESLLQRVMGDDVRVEVALANDLSPVRVDAGQLHQVILNLAMNGRDAMPKGGTLRIETRLHAVGEHHRSPHRLPPGRYAVLAMSDTGVGIDPETQQRLFEPFFTTKDPGKGTGLGLATVHGIVKQSGGEICVTSDVGRGTTFTIFLPMTEEPEQPAAEQMPATSRGAECILVVDDDAGVRTLTKRLLERAGYSVRTAADGPDALRVLEAHGLGIDLVLTDVVMPAMSGRELAEEVWTRFPDMRVLFMSGYTEDAIERHGVLDRGTHLLGKPYSAAELTAKVRTVLDS